MNPSRTPDPAPDDDDGPTLRALYRELPAAEPSAALVQQLQALTRAAAPAATAPRPQARRRRTWRVPATLAASLAAAMTVGLLVHLQNPPVPPATGSLMAQRPAAAPQLDRVAPPAQAAQPATNAPPTAPRQSLARPFPGPQAIAPAPAAPAAPPPAAAPAAPTPERAAPAQNLQESLYGQRLVAPPAPAPAAADAAPAAAEAAPSAAGAAAKARAAFADTADGWYAEIVRREGAGDHAGAQALFEQFRQRYPGDPRAQRFPAAPP